MGQKSPRTKENHLLCTDVQQSERSSWKSVAKEIGLSENPWLWLKPGDLDNICCGS